jgi:hypothetical protein
MSHCAMTLTSSTSIVEHTILSHSNFDTYFLDDSMLTTLSSRASLIAVRVRVKRHNVVILFRYLPPGFRWASWSASDQGQTLLNTRMSWGRVWRVGPNAFSYLAATGYGWMDYVLVSCRHWLHVRMDDGKVMSWESISYCQHHTIHQSFVIQSESLCKHTVFSFQPKFSYAS